jgi:tripartite-type tricarboxylate transporter receptor subunit TctC
MPVHSLFRPLHCIALLAAAACSASAWAQAPAPQGKNVRWIVPFPPGGVADILARIISAQLGPALGQTVVVENRSGAGGMIGAEVVAKGTPDGSLLLIAGQTIPTGPSLYKNLPFSPFRDLAPIAQVGSTPNVLVVGADHPAKSVKDLVEMAKANPGKLNYASVGNGSLQQLGAELFKRDAGVSVVHVPFKGGPELVAVTITGTVDFSFDNLTSAQSAIQSGKLRALAFATREREPAFPTVPTMIESGYPNFLVSTWMGTWTTGGSPPERVARLENEIRRIISMPETAIAIQKTGVRISNLGSRDLGRIVEEDAALWDRILKAAGIRPE